MLIDALQRQQAIDPNQSFIVQAPAGSGKTELLTQRFLKLLSRVEQPEQIIAITFTRKAAHEMRQRILKSIEMAKKPKPQTAHEITTWQLASEALRNDEKHKWLLLKQPHRLKVQTIDSLCNSLIQKTPLLSKNYPYADIEEDCSELYQTAAIDCIEYALSNTPYIEPITHLLNHLDNQKSRLISLFSSMLARREQWLSIIIQSRHVDKTYFDKTIKKAQYQAVDEVNKKLPKPLLKRLIANAYYAASHVEQNSPIKQLNTLNPNQLLTFEQAVGLCELLLKKDNLIRSRFSKNEGFPSPASFKNNDEKIIATLQKQEITQLVTELTQYPEIIESLVHIRHIPKEQYNEKQWQIMQTLFDLLPLLAAQLNILFANKKQIDFNTIGQQALLALGALEEPSDLALYMDNAIKHLLIDEFQDTSIHQFKLIEKLTSGWQPDDGRSLFIVGDPMQSIYRFRQAEVGLFMKAQQDGIGSIALECLQLKTNFRSSKTIVEWVNNTFKPIFPKYDDIESGAVHYHSSDAFHHQQEDTFLQSIACYSSIEQANKIIEIIHERKEKYPRESIGLLVRNRRHLEEIIQILNTHNISYQGVDIANLSNNATIQDIWTLTKALLQPANRLSWLSLLRTPMCGLSLSDIHNLAIYQPSAPILFLLKAADEINALKELEKIKKLTTIFSYALENRQAAKLSTWVEEIWNLLSGDSLVNQEYQQDVELLWQLLDKHESHGRLNNLAKFETKLSQLFSKNTTESLLQVMTIHKSKGLEFDCVIIPSLESSSGITERPLMQWMELPQKESSPLFLISPLKAHDSETDSIYDYMSYLDYNKEQYELQRLFYVATTRAKRQLYLLTSSLDKISKNSFKSMLKNELFSVTPSSAESLEEEIPIISQQLAIPLLQDKKPSQIGLNQVTLSQEFQRDKRLNGVFMHEIFKELSEAKRAYNTFCMKSWDRRLKELGVIDREKAINQAEKLTSKLQGSWVFDAQEGENNEYEIIIKDNGELKTYIIDRTFLHQGERWIIDYKTGQYSEKAIESYKKQLENYAYLFNQMEKKPTQCCLFYPEIDKEYRWQPKDC